MEYILVKYYNHNPNISSLDQDDAHGTVAWRMPVSEYGKILSDLHLLRHYATTSIFLTGRTMDGMEDEVIDMAVYQRLFLEDIRELEHEDRSVVQKLWILQRMYRFYPFL